MFGRTNWNTEYNITDHLGSVKLSVNTDGTIVNSKTYSDFGEASTNSGDRLGYIGKENDVESGLGDFGVRKYDDAAGRFLSIDPLWEKYLAWSPYHYCGNNPIIRVDENGLNWFVATNGATKWYDKEGDFSEVSSGETYTDMGKIFLNFNGTKLRLFKEDQSSQSWDAVSGDLLNGKTNAEAQWEKRGPIPEGSHYSINPKEIQEYDDESIVSNALSLIGRGEWPGGSSSWGYYRIPIHPLKDNRGERTGNYFIHGGTNPGSRGCIDLWYNNDSFFKELKNIRVVIPLVVVYP